MSEMATSRVSPVRPPVRLTPLDAPVHPIPRTPSPNRRAIPNYQSTDPLLRNLSPESTLKALSSTDAVPTNEQAAHDILSKSISQVSPAERALGIRAAIAAQNLSLWYKEVQTWDWPKRTDVHLGKGFVPPSPPAPAPAEPEYYGGLPAAIVVQHEKRIEEIRDGMEELDVDELKEHVLNAHIPSRSRPSSSNSAMSVPPPLSYNQLSDFTAVITATILRALPLLSRLNSLLSTWDVRLLVLRQVSGLLRSLSLARSELDAALSLLKSPEIPSETDALYSRTNYHAKRAQLEATVLSAGRRMDRMLDALEGREDSLPEDWIDDLEAIESGFGSWVMEAEQRTVANEWQRTMQAKNKDAQVTPLSDSSNPEPVPSQPEPICTTGRSLPMETIQEEPGSPLGSVSSHANKDDRFPSMPQIDEVLPAASDARERAPLAHEDSSLASESVSNQTPEDQAARSSKTPEEPHSESSEKDPIVSTVQTQVPDSPADTEIPEEPSRAPETTEISPLKEEETGLPSEDVRKERSASQSGADPKESDGPEKNAVVAEHSASPYDASPNSTRLSGSHQPPNGSTMQEDENPTLPTRDSVAEDPLASNQGLKLIKPNVLKSPLDQSSPSIEPEQTASPRPPTQRSPSRTPDSVVANRAPLTLSRSASPKPMPAGPSSQPDDDENIATHERDDRSPKQPLESPIKLSKTRPGRLDLSKDKVQHPGRRESNVSAGSFSETDYPSLISSPEIREPRTGSSNGTPRFLETPPQFQPHYRAPGPMPSNNEHTLREDHLFRLASAKASPRLAVNHNRNLSLPLQRFINERLELDFSNEPAVDVDNAGAHTPRTASPPPTAAPGNERPAMLGRSRKPEPKNASRVSGRQSAHSRGESSTPEPTAPMGKPLKTREQNKKVIRSSSNQKAMGIEPVPHHTTTRLKKRLTAHPSLESIGAYKSNPLVEKASTGSKPGSRSSTPNSQLRKPKDHLDEKISSILTNLPTRIHLMSAEDREADDTDIMSSLPLKARERFRSVSPQGTASRTGTPTPSLTLTPAPSRRRYSHAHAPEESSVKLYHLHRGGKSAPTKLFVRSVGEHGERVMVRVGGGWADLAEYLREYAIHHGRRHVCETPRVEVQGLSSRDSTPSYSPPGSRLTPTGNGRTTPSRPLSVMSNRPSSSLAVRKTRRASNVSDMADFRSVSAGEAFNVSVSPKSIVSSRRRLSASSNTSLGATSSMSDVRHGSSPSTTVGGSSHSIPLGLAGPKPRSRHVSMTPESEAWVEDVLGQARRSSSLRPTYGLPPQEQEQIEPKPLSLPKSRSISDLGKAGSSKRVALRGLGSR